MKLGFKRKRIGDR